MAADFDLQTHLSLFQDLDQAAMAADKNNRIIFWNRAAELLYGVPAVEALGQPIDQLFTVKKHPFPTNKYGERWKRTDSGAAKQCTVAMAKIGCK